MTTSMQKHLFSVICVGQLFLSSLSTLHTQSWRAAVEARRKRRAADFEARRKRDARLDEIARTLRLRILYDTGVIGSEVKGHLTMSLDKKSKSTRLQFNSEDGAGNWDLHVNRFHWEEYSNAGVQFLKWHTMPSRSNSEIQEACRLPAYHRSACVVIQLWGQHNIPTRTLIAKTPKCGTAWLLANAADQRGVR